MQTTMSVSTLYLFPFSSYMKKKTCFGVVFEVSPVSSTETNFLFFLAIQIGKLGRFCEQGAPGAPSLARWVLFSETLMPRAPLSDAGPVRFGRSCMRMIPSLLIILTKGLTGLHVINVSRKASLHTNSII